MESDGKMVEILIENSKTGNNEFFVVWADSGMKDVIADISGVRNVFNDAGKTRYDVFIDPRYDYNFVKKEVFHAICAESILQRIEQK
jgi:hypothetical protein